MKHHNTYNPAEGNKTFPSQSTAYRLPCFSVPCAFGRCGTGRQKAWSLLNSLHSLSKPDLQFTIANSLVQINLASAEVEVCRFALAAHTPVTGAAPLEESGSMVTPDSVLLFLSWLWLHQTKGVTACSQKWTKSILQSLKTLVCNTLCCRRQF